jgi:hypothetical protein
VARGENTGQKLGTKNYLSNDFKLKQAFRYCKEWLMPILQGGAK